MKVFTLNRACMLAFGLAPMLWAGAAHAVHPASIAGTWNAVGNQSPGDLIINQPPSTTRCKPITGTIYGQNIEGVYCRATGRIVFVRKFASGIPYQLFEGHVSQDGAVDRMGGTLMIWNNAGGFVTEDGPDLNFSASK